MTRPALTLLLITLASAAAAADLSGPARAIDTIRIGETSVRIWGIAAPERHEPGRRRR